MRKNAAGAEGKKRGAHVQTSAPRGLGGLLLRFFVHGGDPRDPAFRGRCGALAGGVGAAVNTLLFGVKLAVGLLSASVAVTADALNNLMDAAAALFTLLGFRLAAAPPDARYPCGRGRAEYLLSLGMAVLIAVVGCSLLKSSFLRILHPEPVCFSPPLFAALLLTIPLKLWLAAFNRGLGRYIGSTALLAVAADSRNDALATAAVLFAAAVARLTGLRLDGWMGLLVALFIIGSGLGIGKSALPPLLGAADTALAAALKAELAAFDERLVIRGEPLLHAYGPGRCYATVQVEPLPELAAAEREALLAAAAVAAGGRCGVTLTVTAARE